MVISSLPSVRSRENADMSCKEVKVKRTNTYLLCGNHDGAFKKLSETY